MGLESEALKRNLSDAPEPTEVLTGRSAKEPDEFQTEFPGAQII